MAKAPSLNVLISGDPRGLLAAFATSNAAAATWAAKMKAAALSPAGLFAAGAVGAGVALAKIGEDFDTAYDRIRVGTGATGEVLDGLKDDFKTVFASVPDDSATVGQALADLNTRMGLTGEPLADLTELFLDLSRITGTDVSSNVANMTRVFGDWSVSTEDSADALDVMFRAAQASGVGLDQLSGGLVKFGAPMRQLGFSFTEATAILSKFEKEGVNTELVMGSMRVALGRMARAGEEPIETFGRVTDEIRNAANAGEANALALEMFGSRAGPDMAAAIREGRFEIGDLHAALALGTDTSAAATEDTQSMSESMGELKNAVKVAVEPAASKVFEVLGDAMGWVTENANWLIPVLGAAVGAIAAVAAITAVLNLVMAANPIALVVVAVAALVAGLVWAYNNVDWFRSAVETAWNAITAAVSWAWENVLRPVWDLIYWYIENVLIRYVQVLWTVYSTVWDAIAAAVTWAWENVIRPVWDAIWGFVENTLIPVFLFLWETVRAVWDGVTSAIGTAWGFVSDVFGKLMAGIERVRSWIGDKVEAVVGFFTSLPERIASAVTGLWDGLTNSFRNAINLIIGLWNGLAIPSFTIGGWDAFGITLPSFTTPRIEVPDLPILHSGGVFSAPQPGGEGLALLRDGERVLTRAQQNPTVAGRDGLGGVVVNVAGTNADPAEIGRAVLWTVKVAG